MRNDPIETFGFRGDRGLRVHDDAVAGANQRLGVLRENHGQDGAAAIGDVSRRRAAAVGSMLGPAIINGAVLYQFQVQERLARLRAFAGDNGDLDKPTTIDVRDEKFPRAGKQFPCDLFRNKHPQDLPVIHKALYRGGLTKVHWHLGSSFPILGIMAMTSKQAHRGFRRWRSQHTFTSPVIANNRA